MSTLARDKSTAQLRRASAVPESRVPSGFEPRAAAREPPLETVSETVAETRRDGPPGPPRRGDRARDVVASPAGATRPSERARRRAEAGRSDRGRRAPAARGAPRLADRAPPRRKTRTPAAPLVAEDRRRARHAGRPRALAARRTAEEADGGAIRRVRAPCRVRSGASPSEPRRSPPRAPLPDPAPSGRGGDPRGARCSRPRALPPAPPAPARASASARERPARGRGSAAPEAPRRRAPVIHVTHRPHRGPRATPAAAAPTARPTGDARRDALEDYLREKAGTAA